MLKRSSSFIFKAFFAIVGGGMYVLFVQTTTQRELLPVRVFYSRYLNLCARIIFPNLFLQRSFPFKIFANFYIIKLKLCSFALT